MRETALETVNIDENTFLKSHAINNGHIVWKEDITALNKLVERFRDNKEAISESVTLEQQNYEANHQRTKREKPSLFKAPKADDASSKLA